jgi:transposase InsO family protein
MRDGGPTRAEVVEKLDSLPPETSDINITALSTGVCGKKEAQELAEAQQVPPSDIAKIYAHVKHHTEPSSEELRLASPEYKRLDMLRDSLSINSDGVLMADLVVGRQRRKCAVCPPQWRHDVIWQTHRMSHTGVNRTLWRLKLDWYWPGMAADVRRQVKMCGICQTAKHGKKTKPSAKQRLYAGRPWQLVSIDLVGPFSKTRRGNTMVLVVIDHFTRWRDALPIPDGTAATVAQALEERIFSYMGVPERIHADQGAQFESKLMRELCIIWGTDKSRTTPYHPEGNGMVERGNRDLGDALRSLLIGADEQDWDLLLPQIMRTIRASPHHATGETPNYLMFGREVKLPDQLVYGSTVDRPLTREAYAIQLQQRMQKAHETLREQQLEIRSHDQSEEPLFQEGDYVMMVNKRLKKGQTAKLAPKYVGPYKVLQSFPNRTYKLSRDGQVSVENETRLKAFHGTNDPRAEAPVLLEPTRRKQMMGRPAPAKKFDTTVLERIQQMDKACEKKAPTLAERKQQGRKPEQIPEASNAAEEPEELQGDEDPRSAAHLEDQQPSTTYR